MALFVYGFGMLGVSATALYSHLAYGTTIDPMAVATIIPSGLLLIAFGAYRLFCREQWVYREPRWISAGFCANCGDTIRRLEWTEHLAHDGHPSADYCHEAVRRMEKSR